VTIAALVAAGAGWGTALTAWLALRRRMVLVARACHEVRGPLTASRLALHLALRGGGTGPLAALDLELNRAGTALDDLSAARAGRLAPDRPELVELGFLLDEATRAWQAFAERHGAVLDLARPRAAAWVWGDRARLGQACANLLANAAEHGGGRVGVTVRVRDGRVLVGVEDEGHGLEAPVADLVRGARGRCSERGHGLAVAAEVAARHGGRLSAAPSPRGARLVLDLPAAIASAGAAFERS
jgi:signal transduction histidine kinase